MRKTAAGKSLFQSSSWEREIQRRSAQGGSTHLTHGEGAQLTQEQSFQPQETREQSTRPQQTLEQRTPLPELQELKVPGLQELGAPGPQELRELPAQELWEEARTKDAAGSGTEATTAGASGTLCT